MRRLVPILFLLCSSIVSAQKQADPVVSVKAVGSKFQFVNTQTRLPASQQLWDETDPFANGFARVFLNNRFSFVNSTGKSIAPAEFEDARNFSNHLAVVKKNGKWGVINESGRLVVPFQYEIIYNFEGTVTPAYSNRQWTLINNNGQPLKQLDVTVCYGFVNGTAKVSRNEQEGILYPDGRIVYSSQAKPASTAIPYHPNTNTSNLAVPCPDNIGFEYGDFTNWECFLGQVDSIGTTNVITVNPSPPTPNRHTIIPRTIPSPLDPFGLFPTNPPDGSNFCVKLGNTNVGAEAERIRYTIHVPANDSNFAIMYDYAVVLQDPGHTMWTQPRFNAKLLDSATNTYIDCASFEYISTSGLPGFAVSPVNPGVIYKPWSSVFYSLRGYAGKTIYLEFTTADCVRRAHWGYAYIDVESPCGSPIQVNYDCTYPNITTLTAPPGFQFYNWWDQTFGTLLGTGQQITLNPGPTINTILWLEMIPFNNFGCKDTVMVTIDGTFDALFDMSADNGCAPQTFTFYNRNLPSTSVTWDFGDGTTGTGDTVTHTYSTPGYYNVYMNVTMPGGCTGTTFHPITIFPSPDVVQPANQTLCAGASTNAVSFSGPLPNTVYNWTNSNPSIGLPASGTGNIASFTAINTGSAPVTATITVTPVHLTCAGTPKTFTITVNPSPDVAQPANQSVCDGTVTNAISFTGSVANTQFSWTNNNTSIGLAASGNGNIPAFTAVNNGNTSVTATITVTPSANGCPGPPETFTITVNPTPDVAQPSNQTVCNGSTTTAINFTGAVAGTVYNWSNSNPSIGLAASGTGNIGSFTAINNSNVPVTATITVTPSATGCPGTPKSFNITVYPTPSVAQPANQSVCNGASTSAINFTGSVANTLFVWTNNNTSIGLAGSGNGDIPSFTATNSSLVPVTATITVVPSATGCTGNPQSFTISVKPTPSVVQPANQVLCNNAMTNPVVFTGNVAGTVFTWTNSNPSIGLPAIGNNSIPAFRAVNTGSNPVTATITIVPNAAGCTGNPESFTFTVNPTPNVVQPPNQQLCNGGQTNPVAFSGAVSGTVYTWTNTAPATLGIPAGGTGNMPSYTVFSNGSSPATAGITVRPNANGCQGPAKVFSITINPIPSVAQPANQSLCNGATTNAVSFTGTLSNLSTYSWTNNNPSIGLPASGTGNLPAFTAINSGNTIITATITVTPATGVCPGAPKSFTITVHPTPAVVATNDMNVCLGRTAQLSATGAAQYNWTPAAGLSCTTCANPVATPTGNIKYIVRGQSAFGCFAFDTVALTVIRPFQMLVTPDDTLCLGESTGLHATGANSYIWSPSSGLNNPNISDPVATPRTTTLYKVVGYDGYGCFTDTGLIKITVGPKPTLNLGPDLTLTTGSVVTLNPVTGNGPIVSWTWVPPNSGLSCTNCPNPTVTVKDNSYYVLNIKNNYGCITTDTILIFVYCKSAQVFIPNAFTPDGDGLNDVLMVRGKGIVVKTFRIFNRWGELVFEKTNFNPNDPKFGWDGKVRGVPATPDVFVYTAEVICDNGVIYTYKGNSTLLK